MSEERLVSKKSKKVKKLRKALKAARRDSYGPAMLVKAGRARCPNPSCRKAAKYAGQFYCTRCGGGMLAGVAKAAGDVALIGKLSAQHDPFER